MTNNNTIATIQRIAYWSLIAACILPTPLVSLAQDDQTVRLEEIVVVARKKVEDLQDTPISAVVLSGNVLERQRMFDIESLESGTPGFTFDYLAGTKARPTIRGIGSDEPGAGGDPSTVVFLDGVAQGRQGMMAVDMFDISQVDVYKGPQGTLWGKNVVGGAVNIITNKPTDEFEASITATAGSHGTFEFMGMLNSPLSDQVSSRIAISLKRNDGYVENLFTDNDVYDTDRLSVRGHLDIELSETVSLLLTADYTTDDSTGLPVIVTRSNNPAADPARNANGPFETQADMDGSAERDMWGIKAELQADLGFADLTSILAYRDLDDETDEDWDGTNAANFPTVPQIRFGFADDATALISETRLAGSNDNLDWTVGFYYAKEETDQASILGLGGLSLAWNSDNTTRSYAVFGELIYRLSDQLALTAGVRYTEDEKDYRNQFTANVVFPNYDTGKVTPTFDDTIYRLILDYRVSNDLLIYGSFSTGWKSGAFDSLAFTQDLADNPLRPEEVETAEIGLKFSFLDGRGRLNLAVFTTDYADLQLVQFTGATSVGGVNLPSAEIDGVELQLQIALTENLQIDLQHAYLDTTAENPEGGVIVSGRELIRTPENDTSVSLVYTNMDARNPFGFSLSASARSRIFDDPDNNDLEVRPSRSLLNASAWVAFGDEWTLTAWGKNLSDEDYVIRVSNISNFNQVVVGPPRSYGLTLSRDF